jgi:hypothetical protein
MRRAPVLKGFSARGLTGEKQAMRPIVKRLDCAFNNARHAAGTGVVMYNGNFHCRAE